MNGRFSKILVETLLRYRQIFKIEGLYGRLTFESETDV